MPRITIAQQHALSRGEAQQRLRALLERSRAKYGFDTRWRNDGRLEVSGRGVSGCVELDEGVVRFDLHLSLLLLPFRSRIEEGISRNVAAALSPSGTLSSSGALSASGA